MRDIFGAPRIRSAYSLLDTHTGYSTKRRLRLRETMSEKIYSLGTTVFVGYAVNRIYLTRCK